MRWNMFGGTIGEPIKKDKLFFFGDYQGQRFANPASTGAITVFTEAERRGDFSQLLKENGIQLYDPDPNHYIPDPSQPAQMMRAPFLNNQIPIDRINPVARNLSLRLFTRCRPMVSSRITSSTLPKVRLTGTSSTSNWMQT
jgi:hypothetical protein